MLMNSLQLLVNSKLLYTDLNVQKDGLTRTKASGMVKHTLRDCRQMPCSGPVACHGMVTRDQHATALEVVDAETLTTWVSCALGRMGRVMNCHCVSQSSS